MLDTISIGMSGLSAYSRGLRVIADNTANINTPGFKGSNLQFGNLVQEQSNSSGNFNTTGRSLGQGVVTYGTSLDFHQGEIRQTDNSLDLAIDGQGLFILRNTDGNLVYTRDGEFQFDTQGDLVSRSTGWAVMSVGSGGELSPVTLANHRTSAPKATSKLTFSGNLSGDVPTSTIPGTATTANHTVTAQVRDLAGAQHNLTLEFRRATTNIPNEVLWEVKILDGSTEVTTRNLSFIANQISQDSTNQTFSYTPAGLGAMDIKLDFSSDVTSFLGTSTSTLKLSAQDDYAQGALTEVSFGTDGTLTYKYANGQTVTGARLALARFDSADNIRAVGDNTFLPINAARWETGFAETGAFGSIKSGSVEIANVDLSSEFSDLVIMQRGYQASSQVVSTANEMIQELFSMRGR